MEAPMASELIRCARVDTGSAEARGDSAPMGRAAELDVVTGGLIAGGFDGE
jgi:hypothetical protein